MDININDLKVVSFNVNGLNNKIKRVSILQSLKQYKIDIAMLQETHTVDKIIDIWNSEWGNNFGIYSHGTSASKGVAILFSNKSINAIEIIKEYKSDGRFIIIDIKINGNIHAIINIYCPTQNFEYKQISLIKEVEKEMQEFTLDNIIWAGDFNVQLKKMRRL